MCRWYPSESGPGSSIPNPGGFPPCATCAVLGIPVTPGVIYTGGLPLLPWVGLPSPLLKVLRTEVGMPALPVRAEASYHCLQLRLRWDLVVHLGRVDVCSQEQARGVWLLPLIEVLEIPPDLFNVCPVGFGHLCGRVMLSTFQYGVQSTGVCLSCGRL